MQSNQHTQQEKVNMNIPQDALKSGAENMQGVEIQEVGQRLSEIVKDLPPEQKAATTQQASKKTHKFTQQQLKAKLLANLPSEKRMKAEIEAEISSEINSLESKATRMTYFNNSKNYFELNNILAKVRELTDILASLTKATFEMIKSLWLRLVHGIAL